MAECSNRSATWIKTRILYLIVVSGVLAPGSSAQCVDGTYEHEGRNCCLCPAGQYLVEHCTKNLQNGKCDWCPDNTYSSEPTSAMSCEPCTSCSHPNDNLEEEESCTAARNTKCRCRQDHYCISTTETCKLCHPCTKCDPEGIKVACTANNDTVCNDKTTGCVLGGHTTGVVVAAALGPVAALAAVAAVVFLYCRKKKKRQYMIASTNDVDMEPLGEVDLQPYLPEIAEIIGWTAMRDIAFCTNIAPVRIDSVKLDNKGNSEEGTLQLLRYFHEKHSKESLRILIENLKRKGKNDKVAKVLKLLRRPAGVVESA